MKAFHGLFYSYKLKCGYSTMKINLEPLNVNNEKWRILWQYIHMNPSDSVICHSNKQWIKLWNIRLHEIKCMPKSKNAMLIQYCIYSS